MTKQQRTALASVGAAAALIAVKLAGGLSTDSMGLVAEAIHSASDLVAALLTFFAVGVATRPPDRDHPYGHGRAEHLAALGEGAILLAASGFVIGESVSRLASDSPPSVHAAWYAFVLLGVVIAIDAGRASISLRMAKRYRSAALRANALHFTGDLAGSVAVTVGLALVALGYRRADSIAALAVAALVLVSAVRLMRTNVNVLMDRVPEDREHAARTAVESALPDRDLRRLRIREVGGRHFVDVVVAVPAAGGIEAGHLVADRVEAAIEHVLPGSDVVVHVEPEYASQLRERATAAAMGVSGVREVHNLRIVSLKDRTELSLHVKLPGTLPLCSAHAVAEEVENAIRAAAPEVDDVLTHIEPLARTRHGVAQPSAGNRAVAAMRAIVRDVTGSDPVDLKLRSTEGGLIALVTLALDSEIDLEHAHAEATEVEARLRVAEPTIDDVVIHTEPAD